MLYLINIGSTMNFISVISFSIMCISTGQCRSSLIEDPSKRMQEPVKPRREIQWHTDVELLKPGAHSCGPSAPPINCFQAICNPEDDSSHCCSPAGFCGTGPDFCDCKGCADFRNITVADSMKKARCPEETFRQVGMNETEIDIDEVKPEAPCGPTTKKVCEINPSNRLNGTEGSRSKHCWCETNYRLIAKVVIVLCLALSGCIGIVQRKFGVCSKCGGLPTLQRSESAR